MRQIIGWGLCVAAAGLVLVVAFAPPSVATAKGPSGAELAFIKKVEDAQEEIRRLRREYTARINEYLTRKEALVAQSDRVKVAARARRIALAEIAAARNDLKRGLRPLKDAITRIKIDIRSLEQDLARAETTAEKQRLNREIRSRRRNLGILERQLARSGEGRFAERVAEAERAYEQARDTFFDEKGKETTKLRATQDAETQMCVAEEQCGAARDRLVDLRLAAPEALASMAPPYLVSVFVDSAGARENFYEVSWKSAEELKSRELEVCQELLKESRPLLKKFREGRDQVLTELEDAVQRWHAHNALYRRMVFWEGWKRIQLERYDVAYEILTAKKGHIVIAVLVEAGSRMSDLLSWYMGKQPPYFNLPKVADIPTERTVSDIAAESFWAGIRWDSRTKSALKAAVKNSIVKIARDEQGVFTDAAVRDFQKWTALHANIYCFMKNARPTGVVLRSARASLKFATRQRTKALKEILRDVRKKLLKDAIEGALKDVAKELIKGAWERDRAKVFFEMYLIDLEYQAWVKDLRAASADWQFERNKVKALEEIRE